MRTMNESDLKYIISRLLNLANDAVKKSKEDKDDLFYQGKNLAYYEMVSVLKNELSFNDADLKKFGMDFDPDKMV
jgi:hypothetical protein